MKVYCVYHKDCLDGFAAALAVKLFNDNYKVDVEFIATTYGDPVPVFEPNSDILIVDFSYPSSVLKSIDKSCRITIIDHHISAIRELANAFNLQGYFFENKGIYEFKCTTVVDENIKLHLDTQHSGAYLTYQYLIGREEETIPILFKMVEDRDLWKFQYKETKAYTRYLTTLEWDFALWELALEKPLEEIESIGAVLLKDDANKIRWHLENALEIRDLREYVKEIDLTDTGLLLEHFKAIAVVNVPKYLVSETLHCLVDDYPFVIGYHNGKDERIYRFNSSQKGRVDVSVLSKRLGGGGHRNAAGLRVMRSESDKLFGF